MTDSRVTQVAPLVGGTDTSDTRISQVAALVGGSDTSQRRISQVVLLVAGKISTSTDHWGWTASTGEDSWQAT